MTQRDDLYTIFFVERDGKFPLYVLNTDTGVYQCVRVWDSPLEAAVAMNRIQKGISFAEVVERLH